MINLNARILLLLAMSVAMHGAPLRVGVVGLVHGHVKGFLRPALARADIQIVGYAEPDASVAARYVSTYKLDSATVYNRVEDLLDKAKPEAVVVFTNTFDHRKVVELCAARGIHVMMEKPLAVSVDHARAMAAAAKKGNIHVLVNYETTWYPNNQLIWEKVKQQKALGDIRKVVVRDGHQGPKEIGVEPEFLDWLSDPERNGAGALFDFGCYGANLMTWLMDNRRPLTVTAVTQQMKPEIYKRVDDDATILLTYPGAQATIQASWNWPYSRKDMDIFGQSGSLLTIKGESIRLRSGNEPEQEIRAKPYSAPYQDPVSYFAAVVRGEIQPLGLSSLENNLIVTEILAAARRSAVTGKTVHLN
jgi:predicted dehydrogenase